MQSLSDSNLLVESEPFFIHKCSFCHQIMEISEGDVVYNTKWYHKSCWDVSEKEPQDQKSDHDIYDIFALLEEHA